MKIVDALLTGTGKAYKVVEVPDDLELVESLRRSTDLDSTRVSVQDTAGEELYAAMVRAGAQNLREQAALMLVAADRVESIEKKILSRRNEVARRLGRDTYDLLPRERQTVINSILSEERPKDVYPK